jgi:hypothetical protein
MPNTDSSDHCEFSASAPHAADRRMYAVKHGRSATALTWQTRDVLLGAIAEQIESNGEPAAELTEHMRDRA